MKKSGSRCLRTPQVGPYFRKPILIMLLVLFTGICAFTNVQAASGAAASDAEGVDEDIQVIQKFTEEEIETSAQRMISEETKHVILFVMGIALLVFLLVTAVLGVNMAVFGKNVFIAHTIFAGFSVTLAIVHAVTAIVWFFPF